MTRDEAKDAMIRYWMQAAEESLQSARSEAQAARYRFAINRAYYACFYAASALLLRDDRHFVKHAGVREALHRDLINPGRLAKEFGDTYDRLFSARHVADYSAMAQFGPEKTAFEIEQAEQFVQEMRRRLGQV